MSCNTGVAHGSLGLNWLSLITHMLGPNNVFVVLELITYRMYTCTTSHILK